jgi:F-type H+-transporting ATPase subunit delta
MSETGLGQRYGQALFGAALAAGVENEVGDDLRGLLAIQGEDRIVELMMEAPNITDDEKHAFFDRVFKGRTNDLTLRFFHLLLDKRRTFISTEAAEAYIELLHAHRGEVKARVTSAGPLEDAEIEKLRAALEKRTGKKIEIDSHVNPDVLGGLVVVMGDQILDGSVRTQLREFREKLLETNIQG